jgi:ribA/ribD-fused uncharacterized protein
MSEADGTTSRGETRLKAIARIHGRSNMSEIHFRLPTELPYGALSNYYRRPLLYDGLRYPSAEHAYQGAKARRTDVRDWIAGAPTAMLAAVAGDGLPEDEVVPGWKAQHLALMRGILRAKFTLHDDLRALLLSTGDAVLIECALEDSVPNRFWSKVNGEGMNMLGVLLTELRSELRVMPIEATANGNQQLRKSRIVSERFG